MHFSISSSTGEFPPIAFKNSLICNLHHYPSHCPRNCSRWPLSGSSLNVCPGKLTQTGLDGKENHVHRKSRRNKHEGLQQFSILPPSLCLPSQTCFLRRLDHWVPSALVSYMHSAYPRGKGSFLQRPVQTPEMKLRLAQQDSHVHP